MADTNTTDSSTDQITFHVKSSSDAKYTLTVDPAITVLELKNKLSASEYADVPAERQRLIYSGRVLKDTDTVSSYKIKEGNTVHMVKSAASNQRQNPASQSTPSSSGAATGTTQTPGVPRNFATGTGTDPLAGLTGARYAGFAQLPGAGMFGPDGGMGAPPDPDQMINMLQNPMFQSTMNEALQNPQLIDMMINQNPMLRNMGPGVRQMMMSPEFRRMLTDPDTLRSMSQMQRAMGGGSLGGGDAAFPAPGVTATTTDNHAQAPSNESATSDQTDATGTPQPQGATQPPPNPFSMFGQPGGAGADPAANPFAALFANNPFLAGAGQQNQNATGTTGTPPPSNPFLSLLAGQNQAGSPGVGGNPTGQAQQPNAANPFAGLANNPLFQNPALLEQMMQGFGGQAGSGTPPPTDTRPPEDRYADQLRQLNDMGFFDFDRNVAALRRSGGSVQGAVEYLLSQ